MTARHVRHRYQYGRAPAAVGAAWSLPPGGDRTAPPPVVVHAARDGSGRRVTLRGKQAGLAHSVADVIEILRLAGVDLDVEEAAESPLIEWRGGASGVWWAR